MDCPSFVPNALRRGDIGPGDVGAGGGVDGDWGALVVVADELAGGEVFEAIAVAEGFVVEVGTQKVEFAVDRILRAGDDGGVAVGGDAAAIAGERRGEHLLKSAGEKMVIFLAATEGAEDEEGELGHDGAGRERNERKRWWGSISENKVAGETPWHLSEETSLA